MTLCGDSSTGELPLFQGEDGGSSPTSPLQLRFKEIRHDTALSAYKLWHYLGGTNFISKMNFGAYSNGLLCGAISYGPPNATDLKGYWDRNTQMNWWEIKRLAMSPICPKNSESRMIGVSLRLLKQKMIVRGVVTYADTAQKHEGTIYKATGFLCLGKTKPKKDFYVDGKIQQRGRTRGVQGEWRDRSVKILFVKDFRVRGEFDN